MAEHARILVVDNDVNIRKSFEPILSAKGYSVDLAADNNQFVNEL